MQLLRKLVDENSEELFDDQREAFADMVKAGRPLTEKQIEWVVSVAERLGIDPAINLFTKMPIAEQEEHRAKVKTTLPWERGEMARPLKPPGRT